MTFRIAIFALLLGVLLSHTAQAQDFDVQSVSQDLQEVVLRIKETGELWVARKGMELGGWRVVRITSNHVALTKREEDTGYVAVFSTVEIPIPVNLRRGP
jgi:hypothetical protein